MAPSILNSIGAKVGRAVLFVILNDLTYQTILMNGFSSSDSLREEKFDFLHEYVVFCKKCSRILKSSALFLKISHNMSTCLPMEMVKGPINSAPTMVNGGK